MLLYDLKKGSEIEKIDLPLSLALGCFDGLHRGHLELIRTAKSIGEYCGVLTFSKNPFNTRHIISLKEKLRLLTEAGVDFCAVCDFDEIRDMSWQYFVDLILINKLNVCTAVCGFNFRFGRNAEGTAALLSCEMKKKDRDCIIVDAFELEGETVSSSRIRRLLSCGDMQKAAELLGRNFSIVYKVSHGNGIGKIFGFPTINHVYSEETVPLAPGVYICQCMGMPAVTNFGIRPTVTESRQYVYETYILDLDRDLYDMEIRVEFLKMLRPEKKFSSREELIEQISRDVEAVRNYFE